MVRKPPKTKTKQNKTSRKWNDDAMLYTSVLGDIKKVNTKWVVLSKQKSDASQLAIKIPFDSVLHVRVRWYISCHLHREWQMSSVCFHANISTSMLCICDFNISWSNNLVNHPNHLSIDKTITKCSRNHLSRFGQKEETDEPNKMISCNDINMIY